MLSFFRIKNFSEVSMGTAEILNSLAMIFIMIVPGFVLKKKKIINETQTKGISSIIVNVTWPCLVIDAMQLKFSKEILNDCIYTFFILIIIFVLAFIFSILVVKLCKLEKSKSGILAFMSSFHPSRSRSRSEGRRNRSL